MCFRGGVLKCDNFWIKKKILSGVMTSVFLKNVQEKLNKQLKSPVKISVHS